MKKLALMCLVAVMGIALNSKNVLGQEEQGQGLESARSLFDSVTGIMALNIYNNNNFVMDLFSNNLMSKDETIKNAANQVNTIKFLLGQIDRELNGTGQLKNLKKADARYLKDLKKALIMLRNQANSLRDHANNVDGAKTKFNSFKSLAWKEVTAVMAKQ